MFQELKKAFGRITAQYKENENVFISDNYYLLSTTYDTLKRQRKIINKYSYLKKTAKRFTEENNYTFKKSAYIDYMKKVAEKLELDKPTLDVMPSIILSYVIISISNHSEIISRAIEMIRVMTKTDFSAFGELLFSSEPFLETIEMYKEMTKETKDHYREALSNYAKKYNYTLKQTEKVLQNKEKEITSLLFSENKSYVFYVLSGILFVIVALLYLRFLGAYATILFLPLWLTVGEISDVILSKFQKKSPVLRIDPQIAQKEPNTLVVTTSLIGDSDTLFENLELFYLSNKTAPAYFGLLLDHPDSDTKEDEKSKELTEKAKRKINELNEKYGEKFYLFLRDRVENNEGVFYGWERKRGAVTELVRFIYGEKTTVSHFVGNKTHLKNLKYLLTLDSDTLLTLESVNEILGAMMHPHYRPKKSNGRVEKGYGIMQPKMRPTIESASKTPFSSMMCGSGGTDIYESASYDRYMSIFGEGAFCGKGIIDIELFYELVSLPENFVLSHDLPEGAILRTFSLCDVTLSDSTPKNMLSYATRNGRWCRGDVQNLWLWNKVGKIGRIMMLSNIARIVSPVLQVASVLFSLLLEKELSLLLTLFALLPSVLPFFATITVTPSYFILLAKRRTFTKITKNALSQIYLTAYKVLSLCYISSVNLISTLRSVVRMTITKKKRLEWITASEIDRSGKGGFWYFVQRMLSSSMVGVVVFVFSNTIFQKILGLSWFLFPLVAYLQSLPMKKRKNENNKKLLLTQTEKMYRFFYENVNASTNHLPPDNISYFPTERVAMRTSPTNIALYLLSTISACDLSIISKSVMKERLENTLSILEKLEKWNGHLYNWYDLNDLTVLGGRYVSTVDSGNFITTVVAVAEALDEYEMYGLSKRYKQLLGADIKALYNSERELFYLGYDEADNRYGDICYDLYMSEARTTSYFACAMGEAPKKHWKTLSRTLLEKNGYIGMASWTGTAFEYFMPILLLPDVKNSFPSEALKFAYNRQRATTRASIYGISESGYYSFDHEMNYQYKAFGVEELSLKHYSECEYVFSPYSTYLMMYLDERCAIENLKNFELFGAVGKYGYYEALDLHDNTPRVIKSYMSHHVGMSVCACANIILDNIHQKRFMRNKNMKSARELLEERIPDVGVYKNTKKDHPKKPTAYENDRAQETSSYLENTLGFIDGGGLSIIASSNGNIQMRAGEIIINDCNFNCPHPDKTIKTNLTTESKMELGADTISFVSSNECKTTVYSIKGNSICVKLISTDTQNKISFDVVLENEKDFYSHSSFSRLFVTSEYDEKTNILFFIRRSRKTKEERYLAVSRSDSMPFSFKTRRDGMNGETGGTLYPSLYAEGKNGERETTFLISTAKTKTEAAENILASQKLKKNTGKTNVDFHTRAVLKNILCRRIAIGETHQKRTTLFEYGISGDFPLLFLPHPSPMLLRDYLRVFSSLMSAGVRCELVILAEDDDKYTKENTRAYKKIIHEQGHEHFLSKRGGIFVISSLPPEKKRFFELFSVLNENFLICSQSVEAEKGNISPLPNNITLKTNGGYFGDVGFTVLCNEVENTKWSFVLAGNSFGTILTHDSLGFSYYQNSKSGRLTEFSGDVYSELQGEILVAHRNGKRYDLIKSAYSMYVTPDLVIYSGIIFDRSYKVYVSVAKKYPIKFIRFVSDGEFELEYSVIPADKESVTSKKGDASSLMRNNSLAVGVIEKGKYIQNGVGIRKDSNDCVFFLVGGKTDEFCKSLRAKIDRELFLSEQKLPKTPLPPVKMHFGAKWLDVFVNNFLPYQVYASRFRAKSGYFQSSGAFGYRDQLQDIMALCYSDTELARTHIIRCSARQYEDGSVNHWFFPNAEGVKTKCSDDFMYLPLAVSHYVSLTNDTSLLDVKTEYLTSSPLGNKGERFELPSKSGIKETVYEHCKRALNNSLKRGIHGLPPLGTCDWNDGFSHFGEKGLGESVLNAMQYVYVYESFIPLMRMKSDSDAAFFEAEAKKLRKATEKCFETDRFIRAYGDNGEKLGSVDCEECKIDLTVQAFAVMANIGTKEMQKKALDTMWRDLFDERMMVLRLFSPPFKKNERNVGYIQGYIEGIRENGGQYTHAAVWGLIALAEFGMYERALTLLKALCPSWRQSVGGEITEVYKSEPYALCGDVYYSPKFKGRGGWSHYTGSAGWYYRAILETLMGIKLENNFKTITVTPKIEYEAEISYFGKVKIISKTGKSRTLLDGEEVSFPINLDGKEHILEVFTEKIYGIDR